MHAVYMIAIDILLFNVRTRSNQLAKKNNTSEWNIFNFSIAVINSRVILETAPLLNFKLPHQSAISALQAQYKNAHFKITH